MLLCAGGDSLPADNATRPPFAWHPNQDAAAILAMAANNNVFIAAISEATEYGSQITCTADSAQLPKHVVLVDSPGAVSSLAFTATGDKLAAVSSGNQVSLPLLLIQSTSCHCCMLGENLRHVLSFVCAMPMSFGLPLATWTLHCV